MKKQQKKLVKQLAAYAVLGAIAYGSEAYVNGMEEHKERKRQNKQKRVEEYFDSHPNLWRDILTEKGKKAAMVLD